MSRFERSILGALLVNDKVYGQALELRIEDFSLDSHRRIFACMLDLAAAGSPIDLLTVVEELERRKELLAVGGHAYVSSLMDGLVDRPSIEYYVRMVRDCSKRRSAAKLIEKAQIVSNDPSAPMAVLSELGNDLTELFAGAESRPPRFSEEALALRFSRRYAEDLRYVSLWRRWMLWDGTRWVDDDTLHVIDLARQVSRAASTEGSDSESPIARRLASRATCTAVERLAAADRRHAATTSMWDTDPWLLNTPGGTVYLQTGELHQHRRDDYITKMTAATPSGDCPLWLKFLERITDDDVDLQLFLQRLIGYSLSGSTREQGLFFFYGTGANGKSVFLSTISALMADYAKTAPSSSFTASPNEQHPTGLAGLRGARFVTAIEMEDGAHLAESKIKSLTGGDKISVRFMRGDFFEFTPEFKLVIAGNHKPRLRSVDEAIRRRLHLVPFTVTIPRDERDPQLHEKLRAEFPGILKWAIEGSLAWQREGLNPPAAVRQATADYLASEDTIGQWIEERCITEISLWTPSNMLFVDHLAWCKQAGEHECSQKRFTQQLEARGYERSRTGRARGVAGIALQRKAVTHVTDPPVIPAAGARGRHV
jgi:putative DNA primase/helicase